MQNKGRNLPTSSLNSEELYKQSIEFRIRRYLFDFLREGIAMSRMKRSSFLLISIPSHCDDAFTRNVYCPVHSGVYV